MLALRRSVPLFASQKHAARRRRQHDNLLRAQRRQARSQSQTKPEGQASEPKSGSIQRDAVTLPIACRPPANAIRTTFQRGVFSNLPYPPLGLEHPPRLEPRGPNPRGGAARVERGAGAPDRCRRNFSSGVAAGEFGRGPGLPLCGLRRTSHPPSIEQFARQLSSAVHQRTELRTNCLRRRSRFRR